MVIGNLGQYTTPSYMADPTTGRLAIGGKEIGSTGTRDIAALLQPGWIAIAGNLMLRRSGDTVFLGGDMNTGPTPSANIVVLPYGFRPITILHQVCISFILAAAGMEQHKNQLYQISNDGLVTHMFAPMAPNTQYVRFGVTFMTADPWPTTLPGSLMAAAKPADEEEEA